MPTKDKIYVEAARLFQEKGYPAASMRDLAERLQLRPSSLYSHIRSKEELLEKICFDNAHRYSELMEYCLKLDLPAAKKVEELLLNHIRIALKDPTSITVFNDEWRHLPPKALSDFLAMRKAYEQSFCKLMEEAMREGAFKRLPPQMVLNTLLSALLWLHRLDVEAEPPDEKLLIDLLLGGLKEHTLLSK